MGKTIHLNDRGADFTVISGTGTANTFNIIENNLTAQSINLVAYRIVNVRHFGAKGDGATVDHEAIQAAVNYAELVGDADEQGFFPTLVFPAGKYIVGASIIWSGGIVQATSDGIARLQNTDAAASFKIFDITKGREGYYIKPNLLYVWF